MKKPAIYCLRALLFILLSAHFLVTECSAITLDEIDLMLRSGFSSETILREELVGGRVYGTFDADREKEFQQLNASPALIEALKSCKYSASEEENRQFNQRQLAIAETEKRAAVQRDREQIEQTKIARRAAQTYAASQQHAAAQAEANLNQRVINVLSTPVGEFGTPSADQQRVYTRAKASALEQIPVEMSTTVRGDRIDGNDLKRRQLYQQLIGDEAFVRETLR
ncbi:MAG TPA: hypothetical protein VGQ95_09045 [Chthoniobacterales bacterium]|nr:hypothetical protein [Chthoniobacterales bacterium]